MPWVRLDDRFPDHPKVDGLSDGAFRLHVAGLCHCGAHLTDGFVAASKVTRLVPRYKRGQTSELVAAGVWHESEGGWMIHDYLSYNPSAEKVKADRAAAAERMKRKRSGGRSSERSPGRSPSPSRPEGSRDGECLSSGEASSQATGDGDPALNVAMARELKNRLKGEVVPLRRDEAS